MPLSSTLLPEPPSERPAVESWVATHLEGLFQGPPQGSPRFRGGQRAADAALAAFDVAGYADNRNEVWPVERRGASGLSPYIRHGVLTLERVWESVADGPSADVTRFREELLWQEYARHVYARAGRSSRQPFRFRVPAGEADGEPWSNDMACVALAVDELERDGWLVNQARMWLASHWTVRMKADWNVGEECFFTHLLDGSRAANRLGWQWTVGALTGKAYGFSRPQVERRAPGLCASCPRRDRCPIEMWPGHREHAPSKTNDLLRHDADVSRTAGPVDIRLSGDADVVWVTAESLGTADPALCARSDLPALFVFQEALLRRLRLSAKRLVFLAECLGDLGRTRPVEVHRGDPAEVLRKRRLAATFTPVPGWRRLTAALDIVEIHPWPWLRRPDEGPVTSFSAWRRRLAG